MLTILRIKLISPSLSTNILYLWLLSLFIFYANFYLSLCIFYFILLHIFYYLKEKKHFVYYISLNNIYTVICTQQSYNYYITSVWQLHWHCLLFLILFWFWLKIFLSLITFFLYWKENYLFLWSNKMKNTQSECNLIPKQWQDRYL